MGTWWLWTGFIAFILAMIAIDMFVFGGRKAHRVSAKEAAIWTCIWISLALIFNFLIWWYLKDTTTAAIAHQKSIEFLTGYLLEKSLSVDNIFVFIMIFNYFAIPPEYQRRVLLYGVLGAIVLRAVMILFGVWLISLFSWVLYIFGVLLVFTGIRMMIKGEHEGDLSKNPVLRYLNNHLRIDHQLNKEHFTVIKNGIRYFTPLFVVLVFIEISDVIFAIDSIPAIFGITHDAFIVFTSNIFAILGLRALYFLLADIADRFHYLQYGIAIVLTFIGVKMLIVPWVHIPVGIALAVVAGVIAISMILSWLMPKHELPKP